MSRAPLPARRPLLPTPASGPLAAGSPPARPPLSDPPRTPCRLQRKRAKGWRKPAGALIVSRPTKWGNRYRIDAPIRHVDGVDYRPADAAEAVRLFREYWEYWLEQEPKICAEALDDLRGRDLLCWCRLCPKHADGKPHGEDCPDCAPCHADVLLELANAPPIEDGA